MKTKIIFSLVTTMLVSEAAVAQGQLPTLVGQTPVKSKRTRIVQSDGSCQVNTEKVSRLRDFFSCQGSPLLGACGTLGAAIGGRVAGQAVANQMIDNFEKAKRQVHSRHGIRAT